MYEDFAFTAPDLPQVTSAMLGISRQRWVSVKPELPLSQVAELMAQHRFDVLPICEPSGQVQGYYQAANGMYDVTAIQRHEIDARQDCIYYQTTLDDLVRLFADQDRFFYFLTNHHDILGMVSQPHLRSRPAYLYLYGHLMELERELVSWLTEAYTEAELLEHLQERAHGDEGELARGILERYQSDRDRGRDNHLSEYFYLSSLLNFIKWTGWHHTLGYSGKAYKKLVSVLNQVRTDIAHPVKASLDASKIRDCLQKARELERQLKTLRLYSNYVQTDYLVEEPAFTLRIGEHHPELDQWLDTQHAHSWCYVTAWNPQSNEYPLHENQIRNQALQAQLETERYGFAQGRGRSRRSQTTWAPEESYLVVGIAREAAIQLGQTYGQKAIVWGQLGQPAELVLCDPGHPQLKLPS